MPAALRRIALVLALVAAAGCGWLKPQATPILPAEELYQLGENQLNEKRYEDARKSFTKIVERHPNSSYAPRARFLLGEAFYRDAEFDKAIKEFETFLSFYPRRSEEHTSELQSRENLVCRLLLEKKKKKINNT